MSKLNGKFFCFSPPVMLATFFIEVILVFYTVFRYKLNLVGRLSVALFLFLAIFQLAEYNVCAGGWIDPLWASRIGYVAITILPPLAIHLAYALAGRKYKPLIWPAYFTSVVFAIFFLTIGHALTGNVCQGNYVIFQTAPGTEWLYGLYYYGWLLAGVWLCFRMAKGQKSTIKKALHGLALGYGVFMVPTTAANLLIPETIEGIPSIMCGFAVLFAVVVAARILPNRGEKRSITTPHL